MKNIKKLGLELIQLTNQVLLVEKSVISVGDYITDSLRVWKWNDDCSLLGRRKVISSTKPLEGLPLLVIEDEVDELIDQEMIKMGHETSRVRHPIFGEDRQLAKAVYNKAKETYKFTEEDLRKAIDLARDCESDCGGVYFMEGTSEEIIQSLTQKELYVEVDCEYGDNCPSKGAYDKQYLCKIIPRITDNKIKSIWK